MILIIFIHTDKQQ